MEKENIINIIKIKATLYIMELSMQIENMEILLFLIRKHNILGINITNLIKFIISNSKERI